MNEVGVVGLGRMGLPVARRLAAAGFQVHGCDPSAAARDRAAAAGIAVHATPAALAGHCDLAIVLVGFQDQVEAALFGEQGVLAGVAGDLAIAVASTVAPSYMRALPGRLDKAPVTLIDAPVSRGEAAAVDGTLLMFAGGEADAVERCRPVFDALCEHVAHLGPLGAGQSAKMVSNMILWASLTATVEGLDLAEAMGLDREALRAVLPLGSADNWAMRTRADERAMAWAEKDMMILLAEADAARIALPLCGALKEAVKAVKLARGLPMPEGQ